MSQTARLLVLAFGLLAPAVRAGGVIVVDASGAGDHYRIQRAVDVAVDGDTILVKDGTYDGFTISDKRVYVVAENGASVIVLGTVLVENLAASRDVVLAGMTVQGSSYGLELQSNAGSVRAQACSFFGAQLTAESLHGAVVEACADVSFTNCVLEGGRHEYLAGRGLVATDSAIAVYECNVRGPDGIDEPPDCPDEFNQGGHAGSGAWIQSSFLFASGSHFRGGNGGDAVECYVSGDGGGGGSGLILWLGSVAHVLNCTFIAGMGGGFGCGPFVCGDAGGDGSQTYIAPGSSLTTLYGSPHPLTMPALVREPPDGIPVTIPGPPYEVVFLCRGRGAGFQYVPNQLGVLLPSTSPSPEMLYLGTIRLTGTLDTVIPSIELDQGEESRAYFLQTQYRLPSGQRILGSPACLIVLDSSF